MLGYTMIDFTLRTCSFSHITVGHVYDKSGNFVAVSKESPWYSNKLKVSCVPAGDYELVRLESPIDGTSWVLINEDLGVSINQNGRNYCQIRRATTQDLHGSIEIGRSFGVVKDQWSVVDSINAESVFYMILDQILRLEQRNPVIRIIRSDV